MKPGPIFDRIGLRELRRARKIRSKDLAERIGCRHDYLSRIENGGARPSRKLAGRMAEVLGVPVESLYLPPGSTARGPLKARSGEENELLAAFRELSPEHADYVLALTLGLAGGGSLEAATAAAQGYAAVQARRRAAASPEEKPPRRSSEGGQSG
jgi:transcriptional regulator with XRE-family HTH domain